MIWLAAFFRAAHYASLMGAFGVTALLSRTGSIGVSGWRKATTVAAILALATAILNAAFVGGEMAGDAWAGFDPSVFVTMAGHTLYGHLFVARAVLLLALCGLCATDAANAVKAATAGIALALIALTSHAAEAGSPELQTARIANDAVHLLAAGFWTGGLVVLAAEVLAGDGDTARLIGLLKLFSRWGVFLVAALVVAGTLDAVAILGNAPMGWSATYI